MAASPDTTGLDARTQLPLPTGVDLTRGAAATEVFVRYLRVRTDQPKPDYEAGLAFLGALAAALQLEFRVVQQVAPALPIGVVTLRGRDAAAKTILLNSHMDVVPAVRDKWSVEPYAGVRRANGDIVARGTQDMKSVTVQHLLALGRLRAALAAGGRQLLRTVHCTLVPEEEVGGEHGMREFCLTPEFRALDPAVVLDEGLASPSDACTVFYGERAAWWVKIYAEGPTGHGSRFIENAATERLYRMITHLMTLRQQQKDAFHDGAKCGKTLGDFTTINWTYMKAGVVAPDGGKISVNVVPTHAEAAFDVRITPSTDLAAFRAMLDKWAAECGVTYEFLQGKMKNTVSSIDDSSLWWSQLRRACADKSIRLEPEIFPAATDSRFIRDLGWPAYGFSPMNNTPILLHDHDEFLNDAVFLNGIDVFEHIIETLANTEEQEAAAAATGSSATTTSSATTA